MDAISDNAPQVDIDFLPASYRERGRQRNAQFWRLVVAALFAGIVGMSDWGQRDLYRAAQTDLGEIENNHAEATRWNSELSKLQLELLAANADAELLTYIRRRWPQSQVLAAIVGPLPAEVRLKELHIREEGPPPTATVQERGPQGEEMPASRLPAATRDLARLRSEEAGRKGLVTLSGSTSELAALHKYLADLARSEVFAKVELQSIGRATADEDADSNFSVRLSIRPIDAPATASVSVETPPAAQGGAR